MKKISERTIESLRRISPDTLVARGIIKTAPNFNSSRQSGYCCPLCGSGERGGTGAAKFDSDNKLYCHACKNESHGGHKLSTIDLFAISRNLQGDSFGVVVRAMADEFGSGVEEEEIDAPRRFKRHAQTATTKRSTPTKPVDPAELELIRADLSGSDESLKSFVDSNGGRWRGLPIEILIRHGFKFVAEWTPPKSRVEKKKYTPTERILIPSGGDFYIARFCGNLDDYDGTTRKFVEDTQKLNAGKPTLFLSKPDVLDSDKPIFAVEGALDGLSIELAGFDAIALNSAANGDLLVAALAEKKKKPPVVILMDSDETGRKAAPKLQDALINIGVPCCVRYLFDDVTKTDANDILIRDGLDNLRGRLENVLDSSLAELDAVAKELEERQLHRHDDALIDFLFQGDASDLDFARRIEKFCGDDVRWLTDDRRWLIYKPNEFGGGLWTDAGEQNSCLLPRASEMADVMLNYAENSDERKLAEKFKSTKKILQSVTLLKGCKSLLITADDLNRHAELICCLNGVVNLQTGELMDAAAKTFMMTQTVKAVFGEPRKENVEFVQNFFAQIQPDEATRAGLIRWLAYCLTGETSAEKFMVWIGESGANGKGTLSKMILSLFADYGVGLAPRALLKSNRPADADKATTGLNGLVGRRFAISEELPLDGELDSSLVKNLTGGDEINLRKNFKEYVTVENFAKINISGNFTPRLENTRDGGIRRRLLNMPFTQTFGTDENPADSTLKKKLLLPENLNALFAILVREAVNWYRDGLIISDLMTQATQKHLNDSDFVADFLSEYYEFGDGLSVKAKDVIDELKEKCPAECRPFRKRNDLINLIASVKGVTYEHDGYSNQKIFKGIAKPKPKQDDTKDEFDGEILSSADWTPPPFD